MNAANRQHVGGSEEMPVSVLDHRPTPSDVRLVDGPSPLSGRLQIYHAGHWRSVCTNSRKSVPFFFLSNLTNVKLQFCAGFSWTVTDYETTCRQMGFTGGRYVQWMDRVNSSSSRPLLLENPRCQPGTASLLQCSEWQSRKLGAGVCGELNLVSFSCIFISLQSVN